MADMAPQGCSVLSLAQAFATTASGPLQPSLPAPSRLIPPPPCVGPASSGKKATTTVWEEVWDVEVETTEAAIEAETTEAATEEATAPSSSSLSPRPPQAGPEIAQEASKM